MANMTRRLCQVTPIKWQQCFNASHSNVLGPSIINQIFSQSNDTYMKLTFKGNQFSSLAMWLQMELTSNFECSPYLWHNFTFSFMSFGLNFKIQSLSEHIIAYCVSFDSFTWTLKFDIIRGNYDLFDACGRCCLWLPYLFHNFTFSFMSLGLSFKIQSLSEHIIAYFVNFDSPIWTLKSDIIRRSYELFDACDRSCLTTHH